MFRLFCTAFVLLCSTPCLYAQQQLSIYFPFASATLSDSVRHTLRTISRKDLITNLSGHTDTIGTIAYNKELAAARISAVTRYLKQIHPLSKCTIYNQGETSPIADTDSLNRCVVITLRTTGPQEQSAPSREGRPADDNTETAGLPNAVHIVADKGPGGKQQQDKPASVQTTVVQSTASQPIKPAVLHKTETQASKDTQTITVGVERTKILIEQFVVRNLLFQSDKAVLDPASVYEVELLAKHLLKFTQHEFEIRGHVNYPREFTMQRDSPPFQLSVDRAALIRQILIDYGVPANRMVAVGMGNSQLLFPEPKNTEEKLKNMRVEVLIYQLKK
jgi:outer membrane protein OmpA-like peptidoglycan-associated protein